jgi:hypothetical protein
MPIATHIMSFVTNAGGAVIYKGALELPGPTPTNVEFVATLLSPASSTLQAHIHIEPPTGGGTAELDVKLKLPTGQPRKVGELYMTVGAHNISLNGVILPAQPNVIIRVRIDVL